MKHDALILPAICAFAMLASGAFSAPAFAGFEWKGPLAPPPSAAAPAPSAPGTYSPAYSNDPLAGLEPVISWDGQIPAPVPAVESIPVSAPVAADIAPPASVLEGFGTDVPLAIALQQIAPPGYRYSFMSGVNAGELVTWQGGKPWKGVLSDTLSVRGLDYRIEDNAIIIGQHGTFPPPAPAMPQPAQMHVLKPVPPAPQPQAAATSAPEAPVMIRREKPESLWERLGLKRDAAPAPSTDTGKFAQHVPAPENVPAMQAPQEQAWAPPPAEMPVATTAPLPLAAAPAPESSPAPAPQVVAAAPYQNPTPGAWQAAQGQTLRSVLKNWSDSSGVALHWAIDYDYRLGGDFSFSGGYDEAVRRLLDTFATVRPQPYGQLHAMPQGGRALVIKSYDLAG